LRIKTKKRNYKKNCNQSKILGKYFFFFAQCKSWENSCVKISLQLSGEAWICLKISLFLMVQILQDIMIIISMKKVSLICILRDCKICKGCWDLYADSECSNIQWRWYSGGKDALLTQGYLHCIKHNCNNKDA
jgi:hypothetical protein